MARNNKNESGMLKLKNQIETEKKQKEEVITKVADVKPQTEETKQPEPEKTTTEQPKRKPGRPRKSEAEKKKQYTITFDPKLYERLQATAEETFKSTSQLITDACVEYLKNNR